ncbi:MULTISPECIES: ABC transporter substrate-binding protein [unclassified Streptomyces]|uniref:ABC transporter substrate-binding protein n=1 Tax=unclassified Streptomyces TaxID=2593676 RepID=UPI00403C471E
MSIKFLRRRKAPLASFVVGVVGLALTACGGGGSSPAGSGKGGTLTIAISGDALNLDTSNCAPLIFCNVAYDSLTRISSKTGKVGPNLATSWKWVGDGHQKLELTLRGDAKFRDGTLLTGEAAAASINSYLHAGGSFAALSYPIKEAKASGEHTFVISYSAPITERYALYLLAGQSGVGNIVGPASAADRKKLLSSSDGIGPYKLDSSQTVKGVSYVYVPNDQYFNQSAITYSKIVLKPMADPQSRLNALQAGQVDWAANLPTQDVQTVQKADFTVSRGTLGSFYSLALLKRDSGPLADARVRQALSYATPRQDIANALYGSDAVATSSMIPEGAEGYNAQDTDMYSLNLGKAKKLLSQAGYGSGLTLTVLDPAFFDSGSALGQALRAAYAKIGVTLKLATTNAPPGNVAQEAATGKYDAEILSNGGNGLSAAVNTMFVPSALANPLKTPLEETLVAALRQAALSAPADQERKMVAATTILDKLVYAVPIASVPTLQAVNPKIQNVVKQYWSIEMNPFAPTTSEAWAPGK